MLTYLSRDYCLLAPSGCALQTVTDSDGKAISLRLIDADAALVLRISITK
jgi:hypothetical protein